MKKRLTITKQIFENIINDTYEQISPLGSFQFFALIIAIFFFTLDLKNAIFLILCMFLIKIINIPIRLFFFKDRPKPKKHKNWYEKICASSMPSLHAVRTTILLLFFSRIFNYQIFITTFLTIVGFLIIYSRIHKNRHYPIDSIIGIIIGFITYFIVFAFAQTMSINLL